MNSKLQLPLNRMKRGEVEHLLVDDGELNNNMIVFELFIKK